MAATLAGAAGDTFSKLLPVHGESVPGFGVNANPGQGGEADFGGGLQRHERGMVEKSGIEIIVLPSAEHHAPSSLPSPILPIPASRPLFPAPHAA